MCAAGRLILGFVLFTFGLVGYQNCSDFGSRTNGLNNASLAISDFHLTKFPSAVSSASISVFEFDSGLPGVSFECSLDGAAFQPCSSPLNYSNLPEGRHQLTIRARDKQGASVEKTYAWVLDRSAPTVVIATSMAYSNSRNLSVAFNGSDQGPALASYECKIDFVDWAPCTSPFTYTNLNEGNHSFQVRARDGSGNLSAVANLNWLIDLTLPTFSLSQGPSAGSNGVCNSPNDNATFAFSMSDSGGSLLKGATCKLDNGAEEPCTSPKVYSLASNGTNHTVVIKVSDNAGNAFMFTRTFNLIYFDCSPPPSGGDGGP